MGVEESRVEHPRSFSSARRRNRRAPPMRFRREEEKERKRNGERGYRVEGQTRKTRHVFSARRAMYTAPAFETRRCRCLVRCSTIVPRLPTRRTSSPCAFVSRIYVNRTLLEPSRHVRRVSRREKSADPRAQSATTPLSPRVESILNYIYEFAPLSPSLRSQKNHRRRDDEPRDDPRGAVT